MRLPKEYNFPSGLSKQEITNLLNTEIKSLKINKETIGQRVGLKQRTIYAHLDANNPYSNPAIDNAIVDLICELYELKRKSALTEISYFESKKHFIKQLNECA